MGDRASWLLVITALLVGGVTLAVALLALPLRPAESAGLTPYPTLLPADQALQPVGLAPAAAAATATLAPTAEPLPLTDVPPTPAAQSEGAAVYTDPFDQAYSDSFLRLERLIGLSGDPFMRVVVHPIEHPTLEINFGGDTLQNAASTLKGPLLAYAIFLEPEIALTGWSGGVPRQAYRMIVHSNNSATGEMLIYLSGSHTHNALDAFNAFMTNIIGLPPDVALTKWNYGPTTGVFSQHVIERDALRNPDRVTANPFTLDAMVMFYEFMETPNWIEGAITRALATPGYPRSDAYPDDAAYREAVIAGMAEARALMAIPDPEYPTEMEAALGRARASHPDVGIAFYGKNGTLRPTDWPEDRWHVLEGGVVTISRGERSERCIVAYSASRFENARLLDAALDYCVTVFEQAEAAGGG